MGCDPDAAAVAAVDSITPSHTTFFLRLVACVPVVFQSDCRRGETTLFSSLFFFTLLKRLFFILGVHNDYTKNSYYIGYPVDKVN